MKIQTWLSESTQKLRHEQIESARLDALILLETELEKSRAWLLAHYVHELSASKISNLNKKLSQRLHHTPLAYIIGSKEFYGRSFIVTEDVLIPRPESEALIELLIGIARLEDAPNTIFDIGTGTGCLAITAKLELGNIHCTAVDCSAPALKVAKKNAAMLQASVRFCKSDLLENVPKMPKTRPYVILANLPYVPEGLITSEEITKEPAEALFSGSDGLDLYRRFWQQVANLKNPPRHIITESLDSQHVALQTLAQIAGYEISKEQDLAQQFTKSS